jgi:hypothetical protein
MVRSFELVGGNQHGCAYQVKEVCERVNYDNYFVEESPHGWKLLLVSEMI